MQPNIYSRRSRLRREKRKPSLYLVVILAIVLIVWGIFKFSQKISNFFQTIQTGQRSTVQKPVLKDAYTFLLLGYGGGTHDGTYLTDTIIAVHLDLKLKRIQLISLPRDIWVAVATRDGVFHAKINAVYQMGLFPKDYPALNPRLLADGQGGPVKTVVRQITGYTPDGYIAIDFSGFERVIDVLGGVDITVKKTFTDYQYPIEGRETDTCDKKDTELEDALKQATKEPELAFPCRFEELHFEKGLQHMDGATALKFARSRHSLDDGGDFSRAARQQLVIEAVKAKVLSIGFIPKIIPLMNELEKNIKTDIAQSTIKSLILEAPHAGSYTVSTFVVGQELLKNDYSEYGGFILVPQEGVDDWSGIKAAIHEFISPKPTATKTPPKKK